VSVRGHTRLTNAAAKLVNHARGRFPLGRTTLGAGDHGVCAVNSVSRWTRYGRLSNRTFLCSKRFIRGIRLHRLLRKSRASDYFNWRNGTPSNHRSKTDRSEHAACQKRIAMPSRGRILERNVRVAGYSVFAAARGLEACVSGESSLAHGYHRATRKIPNLNKTRCQVLKIQSLTHGSGTRYRLRCTVWRE
jgi:hypothetical protein